MNNCNENFNGEKGQGYRGCRSKTKSGKSCRAWKTNSNEIGEVTVEKFNGKGLEGGHNYCRNPNDESTIWCYTSDLVSSKEDCGGSEYFEWKRGTHCDVVPLRLAMIPSKTIE